MARGISLKQLRAEQRRAASSPSGRLWAALSHCRRCVMQSSAQVLASARARARHEEASWPLVSVSCAG
jgi:hypothetical protein